MNCNSKINRSRFRVKSSYSPKRVKILAPELVRQSNYRSPRRKVPKLVRQLNDSAFLQHMNAQQLLNQLDPTGEIRRRRKKRKPVKKSRFRVKANKPPSMAPKLVPQVNDPRRDLRKRQEMRRSLHRRRIMLEKLQEKISNIFLVNPAGTFFHPNFHAELRKQLKNLTFHHLCDVEENFRENPNDYLWLIQKKPNGDFGRFLGVVDMASAGNFNVGSRKVPVFYVYWICALTEPDGSPINIGGSSLSVGKLLTAFILKRCYEETGGKPFVLFSKALAQSIPFHEKMGMKTYDQIKHILNKGQIDTILYSLDLHESYLKAPKNPHDSVYMFYLSDPRINYTNATGFLIALAKKRMASGSSKFSMGGLKRWLDEKWIDVCYLPKKVSCGRSKGSLSKKRPHYPYCRPSIRISDKTPKLASELTKEEIEKRCRRKRAGKNKVRITGKKSRKPTRFSVKKGKRDMSYCVCSGPNKTKGFTCTQHCKSQHCKYGRSKFRAGSKVPENVVDKALYRKIKAEVKKKFLSKPNGKWPSAYGSMALVRAYKKAGGRYKGKKSSFRMSSCKCKKNSRAIQKLQKAFDRSRKHKISKMRSRKRRMNTRIKNGSPKTYKGFKTKLKRRLKSSVKRLNKNIKFHEIL